jgi:PTH1 family peptidyl-tRNA hydrolase
MNDQRLFMVAGLGNPGDQYARTRHNIGFTVVEELSRRHAIPITKSRFDAEYGRGTILKNQVVLVKPQSFMNRSGFPIQRLAAFFKIAIPDILVIHDDLDLELGRVMLVRDRGHGGHNGIRSIIEVLGSREFIRIRVGVGRPRNSSGVTGFVLGGFAGDEAEAAQTAVSRAAEALAVILDKGVVKAMNLYNTR